MEYEDASSGWFGPLSSSTQWAFDTKIENEELKFNNETCKKRFYTRKYRIKYVGKRQKERWSLAMVDEELKRKNYHMKTWEFNNERPKTCIVCTEDISSQNKESYILACGHEFCTECIKKWKRTCSMWCRSPIVIASWIDDHAGWRKNNPLNL